MGAINKIEFSDHSVTAWGRMKLMKDLLDTTKIKDQLSTLPLPEKGKEAIRVIIKVPAKNR